jgi:hypothetical protein
MKTIAVAAGSAEIDALLAQATEDNLILKTEDGREFLLAEIDSFDREIELTRNNEALMRLLDERGAQKASVSLEQVRARFGLQ